MAKKHPPGMWGCFSCGKSIAKGIHCEEWFCGWWTHGETYPCPCYFDPTSKGYRPWLKKPDALPDKIGGVRLVD